MIKMIASDLDGTLLLNKAQALPEEIFSLIRELKELGILFVAASGRQYPNMKKLFCPGCVRNCIYFRERSTGSGSGRSLIPGQF